MTSQTAKIFSDVFPTAPAPARTSGLLQRIALVALVARRAIWMTALDRVAPHAPATAALSPAEIRLIDRMTRSAEATETLAVALARLATIGGGAPGAKPLPFVVARGLSRLADVQIAARLRAAKYAERS